MREIYCAPHPENDILKQLYLQKCYVRNKILQSKSNYYQDKFESNVTDEQKQWQLYKEVIFKRFASGPEKIRVSVNGTELPDSKESANVINNSFAQAGQLLEDKIVEEHGFDMSDIEFLYPHLASRNWSFHPVTANEVKTIINDLPCN